MKMLLRSFLLLAGAWQCFAQNARFIELRGNVEIKAGGSAAWVAAEPGMEIGNDTVVSTGFKSAARISLGNSTLTVRPLTRLTLAELTRRGNDEAVDLYLETGRVRAEVSPPSGGKTDFTVRSPSLTASVRGTAFEFDTRQLRVEDGRVILAGANGQRVYVDGGEHSYIDETQNRLASPFEAELASITPALSGLGGLGGLGGAGQAEPVFVDPTGPGAVEAAFEWP